MTPSPPGTLDLRLEGSDPLWAELLGLLQAGFRLEVSKRRSVRVFMREVLGFDDAYIETGISTVFVDGKPVDDLDTALVGPLSRLALSAAMPGLVGAVMRIKSPYASFRASISYPTGSGPEGGTGGVETGAAGSGFVSVKLFNSVMAERGRALLARGLYVDAAALGALRRAGAAFGAAAPRAPKATPEATPEAPPEAPVEGGQVFLRVREERADT